MNKDAIYHVRPADNIKLVEMELNIERLYQKAATPGGRSMLEDVQALIERIKADEKKIRKLEKMQGISWLGDEAREKGDEGEKGPPLEGKQDLRLLKKKRTAANLYEDRSRWDIPINCADGGFREQIFWQGREAGAREMEKEIHGK